MSSNHASNPSNVEEPMAVEATNETESAAESQELDREVLLTDADLEGSPAKRRKVSKIAFTLIYTT